MGAFRAVMAPPPSLNHGAELAVAGKCSPRAYLGATSEIACGGTHPAT